MITDIDPTPVENAMCRCTDNGSMVQAQHFSEWTELWYGMLQDLIPLLQDDRTRGTSLSSFSSIY